MHITASDFFRLKNIFIHSKNINVRRNCNKISRYSRDRFFSSTIYLVYVLDNFHSRLIMYRHKRRRDRQRDRGRDRERGRERERDREKWDRERVRDLHTQTEKEKIFFFRIDIVRERDWDKQKYLMNRCII